MAKNIKIQWHDKQVNAAVRQVMRRRLQSIGARGRAAAVRKISVPFRGGSGIDVRYKPRRTGTASAPGEPPRADTGFLKKSVAWQMVEDSKLISVLIGTTVNYGFWLETGAKFLAARPWLRPMLVENWPKFREFLQRPITRLPGGGAGSKKTK